MPGIAESEILIRVTVSGTGQAAADIESVGTAATRTAEKTDEASAATNRYSKSTSGLRSNIKALAGQAGFIGLVAGIGYSVKAYTDYQRSLVQTQNLTTATRAEVAMMGREIPKVAIATGESPQGLATAFYHLASTGIPANQILHDLVITAKAAQIGQTDMEQATYALNAALFSHIGGIKNADQAMALFLRTVGAGDMTMNDFTAAMGHGTLGIAKTFGLTMYDVGAVLATFGDNNIRGAKAATLLRQAITMLAAPSDAATKKLEAIGISQYQLANDFRQPDGFLKALEDVNAALQRMFPTDPAARAAYFSQIVGGGRTGAGIALLMTQIDKLSQKYKVVHNDTENLNVMWDRFSHTTAYLIDRIKALGQVAAITIGGILVKAVGAAAFVVLKFYDAWHKNAAWARIAGSILLGVATALVIYRGATIAAAIANFIFGTSLITEMGALIALIPEITSLTDVITLLGFAFDAIPIIGWISLAIGLGVLLVELYKSFKPFRDMVNWIASIPDFLIKHWRETVPILLTIIMGPIIGGIALLITHFSQVEKFITGLATTIGNFFIGIWHGIEKLTLDVVNWFIARINNVITIIRGVIKGYNSSLGWLFGNIGLPGYISPVSMGGGTQGTMHPTPSTVSRNTVQSGQGINANQAGFNGQPIVFQSNLYLDSRKVTQAINRTSLQAKARGGGG